jgi:hypothetical protein
LPAGAGRDFCHRATLFGIIPERRRGYPQAPNLDGYKAGIVITAIIKE